MHRLFPLLCCACVHHPAGPPSPEPVRASLEACSFLLGRHLGPSPSGAWEESWTARGRELWEGYGIESQDGRVTFTERLRLFVEGETLAYVVELPSGRVARFRGDGRDCSFSDPTNDFPRTIRYTAVAEHVEVVLQGEADGRPMEERWTITTQAPGR